MSRKILAAVLGFVGVVVGGFLLWRDAQAPSPSETSQVGTDGSSLRLFLTLTDTRPEAHLSLGSGGLPSNTLRSAVSADGYAFTFDPQHWLISDDMADPTAAVNDEGTWVVASGTGSSSIRAGSNDLCPYISSFPEIVDGGGIPDIIPTEDGFRMYYSGEVPGIFSATSSDGADFATDPGTRLAPPFGLNLVADPAVTRRADGTYVMYFKATKTVEKTPYGHMIYRATSPNGLTWTAEDKMLVNHAGVPGAYTDESGVVWIYYLNFANWPKERESVWATYELADGSLAEPREVTFSPALPEYLWVNDPDPVLVPASVNLEDCGE